MRHTYMLMYNVQVTCIFVMMCTDKELITLDVNNIKHIIVTFTWNCVKKPDLPDTGSTWFSSMTLCVNDLTGRLVSPHMMILCL